MYKLMIALLGPALLLLASAAPAMAQSPDIAVEDAWARATVTASQPGTHVIRRGTPIAVRRKAA